MLFERGISFWTGLNLESIKRECVTSDAARRTQNTYVES